MGLRVGMTLVLVLSAVLIPLASSAQAPGAGPDAGVLSDANAGSCHGKVPAIFTFGDSLVDAGNSNYLNDKSLKANFIPYGESFPNHVPTGRHTNGKTVVDFLATSLGLELALPSRQPGVQASSRGGLNFAYAGSGILDTTNAAEGTVSLLNQIGEFANMLSKESHQQNYSKALFIIVTGSNDMLGNYGVNKTLQNTTTPAEFIGEVITTLGTAIQSLYKLGARKFVLMDLAPIGCVPSAMVATNHTNGNCVQESNALAVGYNGALFQLIKSLNSQLPGANTIASHIFNTISQFLNNNGGFTQGSDACCGAGPLHGAVQCGLAGNPKLPPFTLCTNPDEHVFWDFIHPTEPVHRHIATLLLSGNSSFVEPMNIYDLSKA